MTKKVSKPKNMKENNVRLILSTIYEEKEMTVQEITAKTGISKTTVNKLLIGLVESGIVLSVGKGDSTAEGGRKPERYCFYEKYKYVISLQMYDDCVYCSIMDLNCGIAYNYMEDLKSSLEFEEAVERCRSEIQRGMDIIGLFPEQVGALVISCSGIVDEVSGTIENTTIGIWDSNLPIAESFRDMFPADVPIIVNNISMFSGYSELRLCPELKEQRLFTMLFWDDSVGGAVITKGKAENGAHNLAGEIGHIRLEHGMGGVSGEFEALVGTQGVLQYANENGKQHKQSILYPAIRNKSLTLEQIFDAFQQEDKFAVNILSRSAYYIALIMQGICCIYDPQYFILQGFYYQAGDKFLEILRSELQKLIPYFDINSLKIEYSPYREEYKTTYNFGACLYAVEKLAAECYGIKL